MTSYLIDTNHASVIMAGTPKINRILEERRARNDTFAISTTILSELYYAAYAGSRRESNLRNIQLLLNHLPVFLFDKAAAEEYGRIRAELKAKGRPIPGTDAQIAAIARLHNLTLLTADRHFDYVDGLAVENWI